jgi:DNA (cytosine-5)-methyltransferase 1
MRHGSLFSGIGGFDLAAEWMGWENVFHCEWNPFGQRVLHHYWPNAETFTDITKTDFTKYYGTVDIISGGFPCQPYSSAGKRLGKEDERHLWPEMLRAIREISPSFVVGENVRGLTNWNGGMVFDEVCAELESYGYSVAPVIIPACGINAPHKRERVWFVANSIKSTNELQREARLDLDGALLEKRKRQKKTDRFNSNNTKNSWDYFPSKPAVCGGNDGLSRELDGITFSKWRDESIKAYGNAIVPQVAYEIFKAITKTI